MPKVKLHPYQEYAKDFILNTPYSALFLDMGLGKALDNDALIETPQGPRRVGDIKVGDHLFSPSGTPTKVTSVHPHKNKALYKVYLSDGRTFDCCEDHLIPVTKGPGEPLEAIPYKVLCCDIKTKNYYIPLTKLVQYRVNYHLIEPYHLGAYLIQGLKAVPKTPQIIKELERLKLLDRPHIPESYLQDATFNRANLLKGILEALGITPEPTGTKFEPKSYLMAFPLTQKQLYQDTLSLCHSLGVKVYPAPYVYETSDQGYAFKIEAGSLFKLFWVSPDRYELTPEERFRLTHNRITHTKFSKYQDATCFTVDSPDHLFLANDYIPTHNTTITLSALYELNPTHHVLVVAPKNIARSTWLDEIDKWQYPFRVQSLIVDERGKDLSKAQRHARYAQVSSMPPHIFLINRELLVDLVDYFGPKWPFKTLVLDEMQSYKSYNSKRFKALKKIRPLVDRIIGLTGTPSPNGLMDLWPQIYLLDEGKRLGPTITSYRETFFYPTVHVQNRPVAWEPKRGAEDQIYHLISDLVISMKNDYVKLPPLTYNTIYCHLSDQELALYKNLARDFVLPLGDDTVIEAANAAVLTAKLSQMASGSIYTDEEHNYQIIHQRKLDHLLYIVENVRSPILVAYHFKSDLEIIQTFLAKKKHPTVRFDGSPEMLRAWNAQKIPVMLIQPQSAGHGLNLQEGGHTLVWYTVPWSLEMYQQTNARLFRQGQKEAVVIHHLITKSTIDEGILKALDRKDTSQSALLDAVNVTVEEIKRGL